MGGLLRKLLKRKRKLTVKRLTSSGFDAETSETIVRVAPFTMTSPERIAALCDAVRYVAANEIPGAIVECGVWRGGSMMAVAETLQQLAAPDRDLYLFDTFAGMTPPSESDTRFDGAEAQQLLEHESREDAKSVWCVSGLDEVAANLATTRYPAEKLHFVPGPVEATLPAAAPEQIAILRLDTDWYESTRHELELLFPRLSPGGVLIVDDYGYWQGARRAVEEYFARNSTAMLLTRIDFTGRIGVYYPAGATASNGQSGGRRSEAA